MPHPRPRPGGRAMNVSVPKETAPGERRVALVPEVVDRLVKGGVVVVVEAGARAGAPQPDSVYERAGAALGDGFSGDVVAQVAPPSPEEIGRLPRGGVLVGFLQPLTGAETIRALADAEVTSFAMEAIPRITRAQSMDALSSQATVTGYLAALIAAEELPRFFPMLTTAAGTVRPAKVLVLGAGVAGLQAIATARRLGAVVQAFDVRPAVKEEVESLGAKFVQIDGTLNVPSQMPFHASLLYGNNVVNLLKHLAPEGELNLNFEDEIIAGACVTHEGRVVN